MNNDTSPPEIYLDARVARTIPTEQDDQGTPLVRYFSADRVKELVNMARGGPEFFVQITTPPESSAIFALTNYGRIFVRNMHQREDGHYYAWKETEIPDLNGGDHA